MRGILQRIRSSLRPPEDHDPLIESAAGLTLAEIVRRFWPMLRPLRWWLLLSLLLTAALPAISVVEIFLFQRLVDDVLVPVDPSPLVYLVLAYIGLNVLSGVLSGADDYLSTWVSQSFLVRMRREAFGRVVRQPSISTDKRRLGDVMTRLTSDVNAVESFMVLQLTEGVGAVVRLGLFLGALFYLQWQLTLAALVIVPVFWLIATRFARYTKTVSRERRRRGGSLGAVTEESLSNLSLVQTYGREQKAVDEYGRQNRAIKDAELAGSRVRVIFGPMVDLAELIGVLTVVVLGVWALDTDRLTLGGLLAFLTLLIQCYGPVRDLSDLLPGLFSASAGVERVVELLDAPHDEEDDRRPPMPALPVAGSAAVALRGVGYRYPGARSQTLEDFELEVPRGSRIAIVGPSGSGKSTVARLLSRQIDADRGTILVDGHDISAHSTASVRAAITPVLQEQLLMDTTVAETIRYSRPEATDEEVRRVARLADADEFIRRLPEGYQTRIGQRGRSLSGGQRQRLAVARALLRDSGILILDEPTTGLDADSSRRLMEAVDSSLGERTMIVLTHDPVVLEYVDRVVELTPSTDHAAQVAPA